MKRAPSTKIAYNGGGRIGLLSARATQESEDLQDRFDIVGINEPNKRLDEIVQGFKYDSVHGRFSGDVGTEGEDLVINGNKVLVTKEMDPAKLPWGNVDVAIDCTGVFLDPDKAVNHFKNGAKRVLLSAPAKGDNATEVPTIVYGLNHENLTADDLIVSGASCSTNALAPLANFLQQVYGIKVGWMTSVHAKTNGQAVVDAVGRGSDRRGKDADLNIIPSSTGAAKAVGRVLPELNGLLNGAAHRVPVSDVSLVDLTVMLKASPSLPELKQALRDFVEANPQGALAFEEDAEKLVSSSMIGDTRPSVADLGTFEMAGGGDAILYRLCAWYDNEWGFANQLMKTAGYMGRLQRQA